MSRSTPRVRPATADDLPALVRLTSRVQAMHRAEQPMIFSEPDPVHMTDFFSEQVRTEGTHMLVTTDDDGAVVGFVLAKSVEREANAFTPRTRRLDLDQIVVAHDHEGRGHGMALLRGIEALAGELAIDRIWLTVWTFNERAAALFARAGFVPMRQRICRDTAVLRELAKPRSAPRGGPISSSEALTE